MIDPAAIPVIIFLLCVASCFSICCMCCCGIPLFRIFSRFMKGSATSKNGAEYQMVNFGDDKWGSSSQILPSAPTDTDERIVTAYAVAPLQVEHCEIIVENESDISKISAKSAGFQDLWAAVGFGVNFTVIALLSVSSTKLVFDSGAVSSSNNVFVLIVASMILLSAIASVFGGVWLSFLMKNSEALIELVLWSNIFLTGLAAVFCLLTLQVIGALIFGVCAFFSWWYLSSVQSRIPFASAVLTTACNALRMNYSGILTAALGMLLCQVCWVLMWTAAFYHVVQTMQDSNASQGDNDSLTGAQGLVVFLMLISLYWGIQLVKAIVQTTVCGTVACWWFQPSREAPVRGSLFRACTSSFGSVCFGSLLVSVVQAMREFLNMMRDQANRRRGRDRNFALECMLAVADYLLACVEAALLYFNMYAYCYVAAYGTDFLSSGKYVSKLFQKRGWRAIINDQLISRVFFIGIAAIAVFTAIAGAALSFAINGQYGASTDYNTNATVGALVGGVMGFMVGMIITNALESAVAMVFVCFAEDPKALEVNHADEYVNLLHKWEGAYPEAVAWIPAHQSSHCRSCGSGTQQVYSYNTAQYGVASGFNPSYNPMYTDVSSTSSYYAQQPQYSAPIQQYGHVPAGAPTPYSSILAQQSPVRALPVHQPYQQHEKGGSSTPPPMNPGYSSYV